MGRMSKLASRRFLLFAWVIVPGVLALALLGAACAGPQGVAGPTGATGATGPTGPAGATPSDEALTALIEDVLEGTPPSAASIASGGRIYDSWFGEIAGATAPTTNSALWALQSTNTRTGSVTWRCKECHGWDYKGKGGAYSSGSHATGFPGVFNAASLSAEDLTAIMSGGSDFRHDFSGEISGDALTDLVNFLREGVINEVQYIDYATKTPIGADVTHGETLFTATCQVCHGANGRTILFDGTDGIGNIADSNPWETLHKIRFGQPGTPAMPSAVASGWSIQDEIDLLGYAQTLPTA